MARVISALLWEAATLVVVALILGIMYGMFFSLCCISCAQQNVALLLSI